MNVLFETFVTKAFITKSKKLRLTIRLAGFVTAVGAWQHSQTEGETRHYLPRQWAHHRHEKRALSL
jgi:hypothetical protein